MLQVKYWERMRMNIPYTAIELNLQAERLRVLRSNILQVTRMYNKVSLSTNSLLTVRQGAFKTTGKVHLRGHAVWHASVCSTRGCFLILLGACCP